MTKAEPLPRAEVLDCREGCTAWLLAERGETEKVEPGVFAMTLLIKGELEPRQAEVARLIWWFDMVVLQTRGTGAEERARGASAALFARTDEPGWHVVETPPPTVEEDALSKKEQKLGNEIAAMLRPVQNQMVTIGERLREFHDVARRRAELSFERTRTIRVVRSSDPDAPKQLVQEGDFDSSKLDAIIESHANATAWLEWLLVPLQWRNLEAEEHIGLLSLPAPRTLHEWRSSRRIIEATLGAAGFSTREIGQLLPDGKGDATRRVAMRRRRLVRSTGEASGGN